jgi:hypothetical protein
LRVVCCYPPLSVDCIWPFTVLRVVGISKDAQLQGLWLSEYIYRCASVLGMTKGAM